jgi:hypothetical protein
MGKWLTYFYSAPIQNDLAKKNPRQGPITERLITKGASCKRTPAKKDPSQKEGNKKHENKRMLTLKV